MRVNLDSETAINLQAQSRHLARFCVDRSNENGWGFRLTQLPLHVTSRANENAEEHARQAVLRHPKLAP